MRTRSRTSRVAKQVIEKEPSRIDQSANILGDICPDTDDYHPILPFLTQRLEFRIPSNTGYMHGVLAYVLKHLPGFALVEPHHSNIYVALNEAISNAIRHGHKNDIGKQVLIIAEMDEKMVRFTINDQGEGFDANHLPDPTLPDNLLQPGGRGVLLIKHLMDEVQYNERGNQVIMTKYNS